MRGCMACLWPWHSGQRPCPTLSVPMMEAPTGVVFLLGGVVEETGTLHRLLSNPPGENLDLAFGSGSDSDDIVDVATFLEALFLEIGLTAGARADDTRHGSLCQILGAPVSCGHGFYGRHG
jgi:hypothetical protein